ncbi:MULTISPECIES: glutathione peroxidase [Staphylococcus]|uniref:glutathione peroxidase n=1 Tax=Staphylococcus TaxID=1279 RepID=UPI00085330B2|nr:MULTISPECIES: glutathione peroxidase [Staphylococcus]MBF7018291.1 glutathione peroxidase [Staphylococcus durrellii]MCE5008418.1 glutathione peroxidase [Staphylococcus equorum]MDG0838851.1 glutathione peroxidase [Staphylococcus equorum]MDK9847413.1 glutathione peroxidase [Staphylococcus equorum]MDK9850591.1 glutathione peroxidase [Staphylococcus equorum]
MTESIYDIQVTNKDGSHYYLNDYKGKVIMVVNTATKCGLSGQFEELEEIYQKYKEQGLTILGFPCNQFAKQEPGTDDQIAEICKVNFGVTFPIHAKIDVNGKNESPLFTLLKNQASNLYGKKIKWNFTKFIIDKDGNVVKRLAPKDSPKKAETLIQNLL